MELSQRSGLQYNTNLRHFRLIESDDKTLSRAAKIEYVVEKLCGILKLPESKEREAKRLYDRIRDEKFDDVVPLAGALIWLVSNKEPLRPRWEYLIADACMELCKQEDRIAKSYNTGYWRKRVGEATNRLRDQDFMTDQVTGVDYMWTVLKFWNPDNVSEAEVESVKMFCMKMMPILENSPSYLDDGHDYMSTKRVGLAAALLVVGTRRYVSDSSKHLSVESVSEDLCRDHKTIRKYIGMIEDDLLEAR